MIVRVAERDGDVILLALSETGLLMPLGWKGACSYCLKS